MKCKYRGTDKYGVWCKTCDKDCWCRYTETCYTTEDINGILICCSNIYFNSECAKEQAEKIRKIINGEAE
jgi:hypothetical protein